MIIDYQKIDLYGKSLFHKAALKPPFEFPFPVSNHTCFLFSLLGVARLRLLPFNLS